MNLRREVAVEGADGDVGALGDGTHLNCLVATLGGDGEGGVENAFATLTLGSSACQHRIRRHLVAIEIDTRAAAGHCLLPVANL